MTIYNILQGCVMEVCARKLAKALLLSGRKK